MRKVLGFIATLILVIFIGGVLVTVGGLISVFNPPQAKLGENSILQLDLEGIILDGKDFLEHLTEYRDDPRIKGVLIKINSPGGVVGPSQEIYREIKRVREELKKPVVVSCGALAASGAYYAAVAADKIVTNPGTLLGSIGVIMEFVNLQKLYDWAHIQRYAVSSGAFKESGADYRPMRPEERELFQGLINEVYGQFKGAVAEGRKLKPEMVAAYADGRVFNGATAVKLGFADEIGSYWDAVKLIGKMSGLGDKPNLFKPPKRRDRWSMLFAPEDQSRIGVESYLERVFKLKLMGQPLYLMPGVLGN